MIRFRDRFEDERDGQFLNLVADRLVHIYGEPNNVDFVLRLRKIARRNNDGEGKMSNMTVWYTSAATTPQEAMNEVCREIDRRIEELTGRIDGRSVKKFKKQSLEEARSHLVLLKHFFEAVRYEPRQDFVKGTAR